MSKYGSVILMDRSAGPDYDSAKYNRKYKSLNQRPTIEIVSEQELILFHNMDLWIMGALSTLGDCGITSSVPLLEVAEENEKI